MSTSRIVPGKLWTNADGLVVRFNGEQGKHAWRFAVTREDGKIVEASAKINLAALGANGVTYTADLNNDGTLDGFLENDFRIPAGFVIESARLIVTEAGVGGTSVALQNYTQAGAVGTANSLVTATQGANANLTLNAVITGTGALVGTRLAADTFPGLVVVGTYTAGEVEVQLRLRDAR
jgi:outer membrane protein assembly factor BamB